MAEAMARMVHSVHQCALKLKRVHLKRRPFIRGNPAACLGCHHLQLGRIGARTREGLLPTQQTATQHFKYGNQDDMTPVALRCNSGTWRSCCVCVRGSTPFRI